MNYQAHYNSLINKSPKMKPAGQYTERHRIIPGNMGGEYTYDNCVYLSPEEHFVAHQLLARIYKGNKSVEHAAFMMSTQARYGAKQYGWLKRAWADHMIGDNNPMRKIPPELNPAKRPESRKKMSDANRGEKNPWFGKPGPMAGKPSPMLGKTHSEETKNKMSISMIGNKNNLNKDPITGKFLRKGE